MNCVVQLEDCMGLVDGETGSCRDASVTSGVGGTGEGGVQVEREVRLQRVCEVYPARPVRPSIVTERKFCKLHLTISRFVSYCRRRIAFETWIAIMTRDIKEVIDINGMIILKYILKYQFCNMWTTFLWL
jgi:hypothetical protein